MDTGSYALEAWPQSPPRPASLSDTDLVRIKNYLEAKLKKVSCRCSHSYQITNGLEQEFYFVPIPTFCLLKNSNSCPIASCSGNCPRGYIHHPRSEVSFVTRKKLLHHIDLCHPGVRVLRLNHNQITRGMLWTISLIINDSC